MFHPLAYSTSKRAARVHAYYARFRSAYDSQDKPLYFRFQEYLIGKAGDIMLKINPLSTLYVGIDVSSKSNYVCALDFYKNKYINSSFANNQPGAEE